MTAEIRNRIAENLLALLPFYHKRIFRPGEHGLIGMKAAQYRTLGILMRQGTLPMSELGKQLYISKPYMTALVSQLIADGHVQRIPDPRDRRVINIAITARGKRDLREVGSLFREDVKLLIADLGPQDIEDLCRSLETLNRILAKIP